MRISDWSSDVCSSDLVVILAVERLDVERQPRGLRQAVEEMLEHLGIHLAESFLRERAFPHEIRPPRNVERDARQRLVHRAQRVAVAADAALVAQRQIGSAACRESVCQYV